MASESTTTNDAAFHEGIIKMLEYAKTCLRTEVEDGHKTEAFRIVHSVINKIENHNKR